MDLGTLIIAIISILAFVIPFIILNRKNKDATKALVKSLKEYASGLQYEVHEFEKEGNIVLGIDTDKRIAFFLNAESGEVSETSHVDLSTVTMCKVDQTVRNLGENGGTTIKKIALNFQPRGKKDEVLSFVLFDDSNEGRLTNEVQLARKWVDIFNRRIK